MQKISVTVIVPVFNRASIVEAALRSVQAQTRADWEAVIVDDGSTDHTLDVVKQLTKKDNRIKLISHGRNRGAQAARNTGVRSASAKWVAFLDSDDRWLPQSLDIRLEAACRNKISVVHSECYAIREDGKTVLFAVRLWREKCTAGY